MKHKKIILSILAFIAILLPAFLTGCKADKSIKIWQADNITEVKRNQELVISMEKVKVDLSNIDFIVEGSAVITNDGKLKVNNDAEVNSTIKVYAKSDVDNVKSNTLTFIVVDLLPSSISVQATSSNLTLKGKIGLNIQTDPSFATVNAVTYSVDKPNLVEIVDGKLQIKSSVTEIVDGAMQVKDEYKDLLVDNETTFTVTAKLNANNAITASKTFTYKVLQEIDTIFVNDSIIDVKNQSSASLNVSTYNLENVRVNAPMSDFQFASEDNSVATITSDGKIVAHKHGKTRVTVTYTGDNSINASCYVYIVATPNEIQIDTTKVSTYISTKKELSYSKLDTTPLDLYLIGTELGSGANTVETSQKFDYTFTNQNNDPSEQIATVDGNKITFLKTGDVTIKAKSNSKIDGLSADEIPSTVVEKELVITAHVNEGVNIRTLAELKAFSLNPNVTTANMLCDLNMTATDNFDGKTLNGSECYSGLIFTGDRYINGNGYKFTTDSLPYNESSITANSKGNDLFTFKSKTANTPFDVQISNWSIFGSIQVTGAHTRQPLSAVHKEGTRTNIVFHRGIWIQGDQVGDGKTTTDECGKSYVKNMKLDNVEISNFWVGLRISHAVDGMIQNSYVHDCFGNGIESVQNIMTLNNLHLGQMGAFGIEVTPDDMINQNTTNPQGTAGVNYNQTQHLSFTGTIESDNYNNGTTPYMQGLNSQIKQMSRGAYETMQAMMTAINGQVIQAILDQSGLTGDACTTAQQHLETLLYRCLFKNRQANGEMNFYTLIFVNPVDITNYDKGNQEGKFAQFDNIKNINEILIDYATNHSDQLPENYTGCETDQYLLMDLGSLGQIIMVNQAYKAN